MSDKDKKKSGNLNEQNKKDSHIQGNSQERSKTTREEWDKIDKKGHGAGDRPKR